jgi:drug/metabolite transporter (DMT)-like permease
MGGPSRVSAVNRSGFGAGVAAALGAVLIWGLQIPIGKQVLAQIDGFSLGLIRYIVAMLGFVAFLVWKEGWPAVSPVGHFRVLSVAGGVGIAGSVLLVFAGLSLTRPESAAIIGALQPAIAVIAQWWLERRRPERFTLGCVAVAFFGVLLVVSRGGEALRSQHETSINELIGNMLVFLGSIAWVTYSVSTRAIAQWSSARISALTCMFGVAAATPIWWLAYAFGATYFPEQPDGALMGKVAFLAVFGALVAIFLWNISLRRIGTLNSVLLSNLTPVVAFAALAVLGAEFSAVELVGAGLVVGALAANNLRQRRLSVGPAAPR